MPITAEDYDRYQREGGIADLSARAKFRLTGADRVRYLNGQVTANITKLAPGRATPACITTPKGRLCGDLFITAEPDALLIDAEPELRESLLARLERYIISDDVAVEDITDTRALFHLLKLPPTAVPSAAASSPICAHRFGPQGHDLWLERGTDNLPSGAGILPVLEALRQDASSALLPPDLLEVLRIEAGVPRWGRELGEETLPPEAGLDRTHIDYHKGCYIGQEVISRLKSIGHVNRTLRGFVSLSGEPLQPGLRLFLLDEPGKPLGDLSASSLQPPPSSLTKPVGQVTSAAWSFALAKPVALGYLKRETPGERLLAVPPDTEGPGLEVRACDLPFTS